MKKFKKRQNFKIDSEKKASAGDEKDSNFYNVQLLAPRVLV
jgi:hypothetical protein